MHLSLKITHFLRLFWVRRRMVFYILAAGIMFSGIDAYHLPAMYTSTTTLMPPDSVSSNSNLMGLLSSSSSVSSVGSSLLGVKTPGALFIGILGSRTVQESLVGRFDLIHYYKTSLVEDACTRLSIDSHIMEDPKNGIIRISVDAKNPMLASKIAQAYVEELDRVVALESTSAARRERVFLEERLKEIKQDLDNSAEILSQFSTNSRTIDVPSQARAMVDAGLKLQDELATARSDLSGLRQMYSEENVRVRTASARVDELQRQMDKITGASQGRGSRVDTSEPDYPSLGALPALGLTYADLDRKVLVEEALWEALTKQYEAAKVQEAREIPSVRVLDAANVPQRKSYPVRRSIVFLGTTLSLFAACILVFILSFWEEMDAQDERKKLVIEIVDTTLNSQKWIWRLPGISWLCARIRGV
jgi:uncharacterized protein involved in exopolysaccharide biosynthesis